MTVPGYTTLRGYRYERKFRAAELTPQQVIGLVKRHPSHFYPPYPPRYVNNLYLDTPDLSLYHDNLNGAARRRKVRVRWYGGPFGEIQHSMLEIKIKEGWIGTKQTYPLAPFRLDTRFCSRVFQDTLTASKLPPDLLLRLRGLELVLFNRYYRHYFSTYEGDFRLTVDQGQTFYKVNGAFGNSFTHRQVNPRNVVVELKYEVAQEMQASRVAGHFPFRMTRNSKYVQGVEKVYF